MVNDRHMSRLEIATLTGLNQKTIGDLLRPEKRTKMVTRRADEAIARVHDDDWTRALGSNSLVPVKKSLQVLYSLCAQGWSIMHMAEIIENNTGESGMVLASLRDRARTSVTKKTENKMLWLAKAIGDSRGPSKNNLTKFRNRGIFPNKHYNLKGDLLESSLSAEQRSALRSVQSSYD